MNERELFDMELHTVARLDDWYCLRVPGGWIYTKYRLDNNQMNSVFVPEES